MEAIEGGLLIPELEEKYALFVDIIRTPRSRFRFLLAPAVWWDEVTLKIMKPILVLTESDRTLVDRKGPTHGDSTARH
jgi:hypothetical protein